MNHRSWMRSQGFTPEVFDGRPVIGIATTWSELAPCNVHLHRVAESVKRGVWQSGGFPLEFPAMALGETLLRPTAMLYRNLLAMEAEELIRANPLDGVVLLSGCDKTTPGLLMAAASVDLPAIMVTGGPMLSGKYQGADVGSGTAVWRFEEELLAGRMTADGVRVRRGVHGPVERALHDDGHRVHDGVDGRGAGHAAAVLRDLAGGRLAPLRDRAAGRAGHRRPGQQRPAPVGDHDQGRVRERDPGERRDRRVDQRGDPPARHRRPPRRAADARRLRRARAGRAHAAEPPAERPVPDGGLLLRGRPARGDARARRAAARRRGHGHRPHRRRERRRRAVLEPRGHPRARRAVPAGRHRHRGAARQPRPGRGGAQAVRRLRPPAQAPRPGAGVRHPRGVLRGRRRPRPGRRRGHGAGDPLLRAARLPGHAGGRQRAAARQAAPPRRPRHGADLRRPDVRHRLRHRRAARRARGRGGRAAGPGPHRRLDHARRPVPDADPRGARGRASAPPRASGPRRRRTPAEAGPASTPSTSSRPTPDATWTSSSAAAATRSAATRTEEHRARAIYNRPMDPPDDVRT